MPQSRWLGQPSDVADLATQFDEIHGAFNGSGVPIYLGEFGLNVDFIPRLSDGVAWLTAVRQLSEARGIGWAFWTYYLSPKAATTSHTAAKRLMQWDCSVLCAALFGGQCAPAQSTARRATRRRCGRMALRSRESGKACIMSRILLPRGGFKRSIATTGDRSTR